MELDTGFRPEDIEAIKNRIRKGDKLNIIVEKWEPMSLVIKKQREKCRVTGVYPHIVTFGRGCGLSVSYTYPELLMMGI